MDRANLQKKNWAIPRPRLNRLLARGIQYPQITVVAPSGYGKSTAVAEYCRRSGRKLVWLNMHKLDNDFGHFWECLTGGLAQAFPHLSRELEGTPEPDSVSRLSGFLGLLEGAVAGAGGLILVMDNCRQIENPVIHRFADDVVDARIEGLCLVLITEDPKGLRTQRPAESFRLTQAELAFDQEETGRFLRELGFPDDPDSVRTAMERTGGWPLALRLMCEGGTVDRNVELFLWGLLEDEYFSRFDPAVQQMFIRLSFFDPLPGGLVRAVGGLEMDKALAALHDNPLMAYDIETGTHRFQVIYRDFLTSKQDMLDTAVRESLFAAAGSWYFINGKTMQALDCFWTLRDYDRYIQVVQALPKRRVTLDTTRGILARLEEIPQNGTSRDIVVDFCRGFMYLNALETQKALDIFLPILERLSALPDTPENVRLRGNTHLVLADISQLQGRRDGVEHMRRAAELLPDGGDIRTKELLIADNNDVFYLPDNAPGQLDAMIDYYFEYTKYADRVQNGSGQGYEFLFAAEGCFNACRMAQAEEYSYKAIFKAQAAGQYDIVCNANLIQMRIAFYRGDLAGAREALGRILEYIDAHAASELKDLADCVKTIYYVRVGELDRASDWIATYRPGIGNMPLGLGRNLLIYAHYQLAKGNHQAAYGALLEVDALVEYRALWSARVHTWLLKARCHLAASEPERAVHALWQAYDMTWQNGLILPFTEMGKPMLTLLELARGQQEYVFSSAWLETVAEQAAECAHKTTALVKLYAPAREAPRSGVSLSPREREVLGYLAAGLGRQEIATLMSISIHGIKKHINGIYTKLGADNRAEALNIAAGLGLL